MWAGRPRGPAAPALWTRSSAENRPRQPLGVGQRLLHRGVARVEQALALLDRPEATVRGLDVLALHRLELLGLVVEEVVLLVVELGAALVLGRARGRLGSSSSSSPPKSRPTSQGSPPVRRHRRRRRRRTGRRRGPGLRRCPRSRRAPRPALLPLPGRRPTGRCPPVRRPGGPGGRGYRVRRELGGHLRGEVLALLEGLEVDRRPLRRPEVMLALLGEPLLSKLSGGRCHRAHSVARRRRQGRRRGPWHRMVAHEAQKEAHPWN